MGAGGVPDGPGGFELAVVTFRRAESCSPSLARGARSTRSATPGGVEWRIGRFGGRALARAMLSENGRRLAVQERPRRPIREPPSPSLSFQDSFRRLPEYLSQLLHPPPLLYGQTRSWPIAFLPGDPLLSLTGAR